MPDRRQPDERWPLLSKEAQRFLGSLQAMLTTADDFHDKFDPNPDEVVVIQVEFLLKLVGTAPMPSILELWDNSLTQRLGRIKS